MIKTYISTTLIKELETVFPNSLPTGRDYDNNITPESIAFRSGIQACISFLRDTMYEQQRQESTTDEIKII